MNSLRFAVVWAFAAWACTHAGEDPLSLTAVADTVINPGQKGAPAAWTGKAKDLMVYGPKHGNPDYRALLKFDLTGVPKVPVRAALLKFTIYKCYAARKVRADILRVHRMLRPWEEGSASWTDSMPGDGWSNPGGDFDPQAMGGSYVLDSHTGESGTLTLEIDVTPLVQLWQTDRVPNCGLIVMNVDNESATTFRPHSREADTDGARPKLVLHWAQPPQGDPNAIKPGALKPFGQPVRMRVELNTPALNQARIGQPYKADIRAKGGMAPYTFKARNPLPEGMELAENGELKGTPAKTGRYTIQLSIADAARQSGSGTLELVVAEAAAAAPDPVAGPLDAGKTKKPAVAEAKTPAIEEEE